MKTEILRDIDRASEMLKEGGLVAIPTETVYGLAANAMNPNAVANIFTVKGRPQDNPLIVHVAHTDWLDAIVKYAPPIARTLTDAFWPGPLTLIFPASDSVPRVVTAGLDTVAVRCPNHSMTQRLLETSGLYLAAPSANISGKPSPTTARHVFDDLNGKIPAILDGGACGVGVESTVLDLTSEKPQILRHGGITRRDLEKFTELSDDKLPDAPKAPGMKYRHYAPSAPLKILRGGVPDEGVVLCPEEQRVLFAGGKLDVIVYGELANPETLNRGLFDALRRADAMNKPIFALCPGGEGFEALRDRLYKAAGYLEEG
ncbi:threonylcarbamoyl-AMP synthase [Clostridia bacterium]|nr:threonylcarbamoyl-AMP synthase [Clostridia bacterium]